MSNRTGKLNLVSTRRDRPKLRDVIRKAEFIEPMLLLRCDELPAGPEWLRELKFDGYRAVAIKFTHTLVAHAIEDWLKGGAKSPKVAIEKQRLNNLLDA